MSDNKSVFESLHKEYRPMVLQMCMGFMKGDTDVSADLTQEIFINVWNALEKFKGESSYKTWIYRITVNSCLKYIRDRKDKSNLSIDVAENKSEQDPSHAADATQMLYHAIGQLHEVDRLIIMMVLDELEYSEISRIIGIREVNLRVKIHRIKKSLKQIMEHE